MYIVNGQFTTKNPEITTEKKILPEFPKADLIEISRLTHFNNHFEAVLHLTEVMLPNSRAVSQIMKMISLADFYVGVPEGLYELREDFRRKLLIIAKSKYSNVESIREAF